MVAVAQSLSKTHPLGSISRERTPAELHHVQNQKRKRDWRYHVGRTCCGASRTRADDYRMTLAVGDSKEG